MTHHCFAGNATTCPIWSADSLMPGFAARMASTVVPYWAAIAPSVSPALTVYVSGVAVGAGGWTAAGAAPTAVADRPAGPRPGALVEAMLGRAPGGGGCSPGRRGGAISSHSAATEATI